MPAHPLFMKQNEGCLAFIWDVTEFYKHFVSESVIINVSEFYKH